VAGQGQTAPTPPLDVIVLPFQLMTTLSLDGGVMPDTITPLAATGWVLR